MTKSTRSRLLAAALCSIATAALFASSADAQRRGGGRAAGMSRPSTSNRSMSGVRSTASPNINRAGNNANVSGNNRVNVSNNNVNINRNVDIDVDHDWGYGRGYRPGYTAAVATAAAVTTAAVVGSYYRTLPTGCVTVYRSTYAYYQCGTVWYKPIYSGMSVQYVVVTAP